MDYALDGCKHEPFSSYLKALAVLRIVGEQEDKTIKGFWKSDTFVIETKLTREELVEFLINKYSPTPIVSPWNGGSGFFQGDNKEAINEIIKDKSGRFKLYRETIEKIQSWKNLMKQDLPFSKVMDEVESLVNQGNQKKNERNSKLINKLSSTRNDLSNDKNKWINQYVDNYPLEQLIEEANKYTDTNPQVQKMSSDFISNIKSINTAFYEHFRKSSKTLIVRKCRNYLDSKVVEWLDSAVLFDPEDELYYPPILGTGGNEGNLEYSNTFMANLIKVLMVGAQGLTKAQSENLLKNSLFAEPVSNLISSKIGKFNPGRAGGANQGFGIEEKDFPINPWDFVLLMEGAILWSSSIGKRQGISSGIPRSPFTVYSSPVGYSSALPEKRDFYEIWAPLWYNPVEIRELKAFFCEGRSKISRKSARTGLEFAEAVASLSVDRGISEFARYAILERRGKSFAVVPAGKFKVEYRREVDLIRELNPILAEIDSFLKGFKSNPPGELSSLRLRIDQQMYRALSHGGSFEMRKLMSSIGAFEKIISKRDNKREPKIRRPFSGLSMKWLLYSNDGSVEFRIASTLASIEATGKVGSIRSNIEPVNPEKENTWDEGLGQYSYIGNSLPDKLGNVLRRRIIDTDRYSSEKNPLSSSIWLSLSDIVKFITNKVDDALIENLLFGMMWIRWKSNEAKDIIDEFNRRNRGTESFEIVPSSWALLKLLFLRECIRNNEGKKLWIKPEISIITLLNAGRIDEACRIARRKLYAHGLNPVGSRFPDISGGDRMAAALLFPVRNENALFKMVLKMKEQGD